MGRVFRTTDNGENIIPTVTEDVFRAYVEVQVEGLTNMWDGRMVEDLSGGIVDADAHVYIIQNYTDLSNYYNINTGNIYE